MRSPPGVVRTLVLLLVVLLVTGCGVRPQDEYEAVTPAAVPSPDTYDGSSGAGLRLDVYFVRGTELAPVERRTAAATTRSALEQLVEGPSRAEARTGIRTALAPEVVGVEDVGSDGVATVAVTRGFTGITGGNQLLAVAQVVWTLTSTSTVTSVRFVVDGVPVEVPTDAGLSNRPVGRDDYRSVTPAEPAPPSSPAEDDPTPGSTPTPR